MKVTKLFIAAGLTVASIGAMAETGVNTADIGYVANIYGRASDPAVKIAGPLVTRSADVSIAGRETAEGKIAAAVVAKDLDVSKVFGRA